MAFNYANSSKTAKRIIAKFGQNITLTKETYNFDTGVLISSVATISKGVMLPYPNSAYSAAGGLIQIGDNQIFININVEPKPTDKIQVGFKSYSVVSVRAIEPAGINILYELQVRNG